MMMTRDAKPVPARRILTLLVIAFSWLFVEALLAKELRIVAWDVDGDDNDAAKISKQLTDLGTYDLYGLTSVAPTEVERYGKALRKVTGRDFKWIVGETGGNYRIVVFYDAGRFGTLSKTELHSFDDGQLDDGQLDDGRLDDGQRNDPKSQHRLPMIVELHDRDTRRDDQQPLAFYFVVNHFARKDAELRARQAVDLRHWGQAQTKPIVAVGNYNFDFDIKTLRGNRSFDLFMIDYIWYWVRPQEFIDTQWVDLNDDGKDDFPNQCQDFGLVVGAAQLWSSKARVLLQEGDFPDTSESSDHRPVELILWPR